LRLNHSKIYQQFSITDGDGFIKASGVAPFDLWLAGREENIAKLSQPCVPPKPETILSAAVENVYGLALEDRVALVNHWESEIINTVFNSIQEIDKTQKIISLVHDDVSRRLLETADVIGITTTGLAKNALVLRDINAKVIICEEAAEVYVFSTRPQRTASHSDRRSRAAAATNHKFQLVLARE